MESVNSNQSNPTAQPTPQAVAAVAAAGAKRPPEEATSVQASALVPPPAKKPAATLTTTPSSTTQQLQQQIQQQLQQQLQAQLQAAAARGQQANITPEQIQAQAQAMVQAAAQAQAVVAAAKSRGDGLVPMNAGQIAALSQIQAQAIVHARTKSQGSAQQIQTQIQLQCQALVHAHTQAQIQAGIYKGDGNSGNKNAAGNNSATKVGTATAAATARAAPVITQSSAKKQAITTKSMLVLSALTPQQLQQQEDLKKQQAAERAKKVGPAATAAELAVLDQQHEKQMADLHTAFRKQNAAAVYAGVAPQTVLPNPVLAGSHVSNSNNRMVTSSSSDHHGMHAVNSSNDVLMAGVPQPSSNSPQFLQQLNTSLNQFWQDSFDQIQRLQDQTEQDFKNHNDLPLARIKRIMKSDEDVRMISAEAPVLFAKACELFILDLSIRSWNYSQLHKRRTLQKEDVREAIQKTDIFDFLVDVIQ
jgi:nuclear transcription factor Y gamma